ncbi:MAG: YDG domain-containing protein [Thermoguttaceae bacterium]|jgi:hypothetical protein
MRKLPFGNHERKNTVATRNLRLESLEDRMLLAVTAGSDATAALVAPAQPTGATVVVSDLTQAALEAAIAGAAAGDTITFSVSGTISLTSAVTIDKSITIDGGSTIKLDAGGNDRIFNVSSAATQFNLYNIELTGGYAATGSNGGVFSLETNSTARLVNCSVHGNSSEDFAGAFHVYGKLYLENCQVFDNTATIGGAMLIQGMWNQGSALVNATDTVFYNNRATSESSFGGVVENQCGQLVLNSCSVAGNSAAYGAILTWSCVLQDGGGNFVYYASSTTLNDTIVAYNYGVDEACADIYEYYISYTGQTHSPEYISGMKETILDNIACNNSIVGLQGEFFTVAPEFDAAGNLINADAVDLTIRSDSAAARYQIGVNPPVYTGEEYTDADLIVTTLDDVVDGSDGVVSLREALIYAELGEFSDIPTITFAENLSGGTIYLEHGALALNNSVTVTADNITIDAQGNSRVFFAKSYNYQMDIPNLRPSYPTIADCPTHDFSTEYMINVSLTGLTLTGGKSGISYYFNGGGGIWADQNVQLAMNECIVTGNTFVNNTGQAYEQGGGGLAVTHYSTLQMNNCEVTNNSVYALEYNGNTILRGGGIFTGTNAVAEITNTLISGNALTTVNAESNPGAYGSWATQGGGVYSNGDLTIYRYCTISDNICRGGVYENIGAGVYNIANINPRAGAENNWAFRVDNSQIVGNVAGDSQIGNNGFSFGAGVFNSGYAIMIGDLIAENLVDGGSFPEPNVYGRGARGAGIYNSGAIAVYYCTITNNVGQIVPYDELDLATLKSFGSGFYNTGAGAPTFIGCILVDNIARSNGGGLTSKADLFHDSSSSFTLRASLYDQGGVSGTGITYDNSTRRNLTRPLFEEGSYLLTSDSQAVDKIAADPGTGYYFEFYDWDLRNDPYVRVFNEMQDYGCYEYQTEPTPTPTFECTVENYTGVYDATAHTITIGGTEEGDTIYYSSDGVNYSTNVISYASVGVRTIYVRVSRAGHQDWEGSGRVTISRAQLTVSGTTVADKIYDGTTDATVTLGQVSGIFAGDNVVVAASTEFPSAEIGDYFLTVRYTISGAQSSNYIAPVNDSVPASITGGGGQLAAPTIQTGIRGVYVSAGANRHQIVWTTVANASGYELSYTTGGGTWTSIETTGTDAVVLSLTYGTDVTYRVRALGAGSYTDSDWSPSKTFNVCPMDINNDGDISGGDRALLSSAWLAEEGDDEYRAYCDINGDGDISNGDRVFISRNWLSEAGDADLTYPPALQADAVFAEFASADLDVDLSVF